MKLKLLLYKLGQITEVIGIITFIISILILINYYKNISELARISIVTIATFSLFTCSIGEGVKKTSKTVYYMPDCNDINSLDVDLYHKLKCPRCESKSSTMTKDSEDNLICPCGAIFKKVL